MLRFLAAHRLRRRSPETPLEFLARLESAPLPAREEVRLITETFCAGRYGARPLSDESLRHAEAALARLRRRWSEPAAPRGGNGNLGPQGSRTGIAGRTGL
jgi:hypothetical protein